MYAPVRAFYQPNTRATERVLELVIVVDVPTPKRPVCCALRGAVAGGETHVNQVPIDIVYL